MSSSENSSNERLPSGTLCIVCKDLATGNHYNVPSCNGCKTFFRRAVVNNRVFTCMANGNCMINKGIRCACRYCRFKKCIEQGMDRNSIQAERDRIGYTKRSRKKAQNDDRKLTSSPSDQDDDDMAIGGSDSEDIMGINFYFNHSSDEGLGQTVPVKHDDTYEILLERLTQLETNFTLLLSRSEVHPYASLDEALKSPSRFSMPINVKLSDPIVEPSTKEHQHFWRSRIIALYIDWAKSFSTFRKLPYSDKVALITNHASSYMIMCEAFRTPELISGDKIAGIETLKVFTAMDGEEKSARDSQANDSFADEEGTLNRRRIFESGLDEMSKKADDYSAHNIHTFLNVGTRSSHIHGQSGSLSGLTTVMAAMIDAVMKPFRFLNLSIAEFATLQAIMFFDSDTEGLDAASQRNVYAEQKKFINALYHSICNRYDPELTEQRFSLLLLRVPMIRKVAAKKNESLKIIDLFNLFNLDSLLKETTLGLPPSLR